MVQSDICCFVLLPAPAYDLAFNASSSHQCGHGEVSLLTPDLPRMFDLERKLSVFTAHVQGQGVVLDAVQANGHLSFRIFIVNQDLIAVIMDTEQTWHFHVSLSHNLTLRKIAI